MREPPRLAQRKLITGVSKFGRVINVTPFLSVHFSTDSLTRAGFLNVQATFLARAAAFTLIGPGLTARWKSFIHCLAIGSIVFCSAGVIMTNETCLGSRYLRATLR